MVLAELGQKISKAIFSMSESTIIDESVLKKMLSQIGMALLQSDVDVHLVKQLQENIKRAVNLEEVAAGVNKRKIIQQAVVNELMKLLDPGTKVWQPTRNKCNIVMFVGLQGSGKTTTCTKLAYHYRRKNFKVALVCADTFRAGAYDQLKQNATKAKIPYYGSYTEADPAVVAAAGVEKFKQEKFELIIVDTSGRHKQEEALFAEMQQVARAVNPDQTIFVMDASIGQAAKDQASAFKSAVSVGSVIITKLDGHASGGGTLSAVAATKSPVIFVGTGEHMDDLEPFNPKSFVSRLLGMGDIGGLVGMLQENKILEQKELIRKLQDGKEGFTFRDMYDQFSNLMKLGSLSKVMSMIPGLQQIMGKGKEQESTARIKRFMTVMDSMSPAELDGDDKIFASQPSRILRIAKGAGVPVRAVHEVIETYKPFKKIFKNMQGLPKAMLDGNPKPGARAPQMDARTLSKMFNPQMLKGMGGAANIQNMMKKMSQMMPGMGGGKGGMPGGMPDMSALMNAMGGGGMDAD